jgi:hypothetical protein
MGMELLAKRTWVDSFLAPLSLTFKSIQGEKRDKYNEDSRSPGDAVTFVDAYCALHPEKGAADGAGAYFNKLMGQ